MSKKQRDAREAAGWTWARFRIHGVDERRQECVLDYSTLEKARESMRYWRLAGVDNVGLYSVYTRAKHL